MIKFERSVIKTSQNTLVVGIPLEVRNALSIKKSDTLEIWVENEKIIMRKR